ncbi:MAG: hypothetical protein M3271_08510 [Actinomycetota bacterium]|nr:hypothetical protein [Actinomycetota bacterium]
MHLDTEQFVFHLLTRSGRVGYDELRVKDPALIDRVDAWFARSNRVAPPPAFAPPEVRGLVLPNRIVASAPADDSATDGVPGATTVPVEGAALVVFGDVAVTPGGRATPGGPAIYEDAQVAAWAKAVERCEAAAVRLAHAGRRAATRPRHHGVDRPLATGGWELLAPSAIAHGSNVVPREMTRTDMDEVRAAFVAAARRAARAGFDVLGVDVARGYLLASFLSPLSNRRDDDYGGAIEARARWPLEVVAAVREEWARPLLVSLTATEGVAGGISFEDVLWVAAALRRVGCDLLEVTAGGAPDAVVPYDPYTLPSYADRIRNESGIPVLIGGAISTVGRVNTLVASGRADLCAVMPPRGRAS